MKSFGAHGAFVGLFSAMGELMVLVIAFLMKTFSAVFANEGLVPGVDAGVGV